MKRLCPGTSTKLIRRGGTGKAALDLAPRRRERGDPDNRLCSRMPLVRLDADRALMDAGQVSAGDPRPFAGVPAH